MDLFKHLDKEIKALNVELVPTIHPKIDSLKTFVETFLAHFEAGANAEFVSLSKDLFFLMHDLLIDESNDIELNQEVGGHASVWAIRGQHEQCKAYVVPPPAEYFLKSLKREDLHEGQHLILPVEHMSTQPSQIKEKKLDKHLVFEYQKGDEILGYVAPRSNRFYFVHDPNGASITQLEEYHEILEKIDSVNKPYRHLFGGYQLMQNLDLDYAENRLDKMAKTWNKLRRHDIGPNGERHVMHVEFGHYSNIEHFELFVKYAAMNADSLGMNEVEMQMLLDYWNGELGDINEEKSSQPTLQDVLVRTDDLFKQAKTRDMPLSRVHLHPYGSFLMCYDDSVWEDAREAIIKGSIAVPKYCQSGSKGFGGLDWIDNHIEDYEIGELPAEINLPSG